MKNLFFKIINTLRRQVDFIKSAILFKNLRNITSFFRFVAIPILEKKFNENEWRDINNKKDRDKRDKEFVMIFHTFIMLQTYQ